MPTFVIKLNWTDQGVRTIKEAPKRAQAARDLAKKYGAEIKQVFLTSGESDILVIAEAPDGDVVAKIALTVAAQGNVRTQISRAWTEAEMAKLIAELP